MNRIMSSTFLEPGYLPDRPLDVALPHDRPAARLLPEEVRGSSPCSLSAADAVAGALPVARGAARERITWIDNAKTLGIFLVVWGHTSGIGDFALRFVYVFHVPLFFFLAGVVAKEQHLALSWAAYVRRTARVLLIPYVFFWAVSYAYWLAASPLRGDAASWTEPLWGLVYGTGDRLLHNVVLWFFPCLFLTTMLFWGLYRLRPRWVAVLLTAGLGTLGAVLPTWWGFRIPWSLEAALVAVGFYGLGFASRERLTRLLARGPESLPWLSRLVVLALLTTIVVVAAAVNGLADMNAMHLGYVPLFYVGAVAGIGAAVLVSSLLPGRRLARVIAENTIVIFPTHLVAFGLLTGVAMFVFHAERTFKDGRLGSLAYSVYALTVGVLAAKFLRRVAPWTVGYR